MDTQQELQVQQKREVEKKPEARSPLVCFYRWPTSSKPINR